MASIHDIWRRRWEALNDELLGREMELEHRLRANFTFLDGYDRNKIKAIAKTLTCLRQFSNEYFHYFYEGFDGGAINLTRRFSKAHILTSILEQIGHDMETLSRIAHDHFACTGEGTLRKADILADQALQLAMDKEWFQEKPVVLSYFQKSLTIRVIPYANVLMLGIPYTARTASEDLLAIPHEVGHYVFWQGEVGNAGNKKTIARELYDTTPNNPEWCFRWREEMFADIYGTYVAGAFIALSFQDLQLQTLPERLVVDDQDHPVPVLRPYVYVKALEQSNFTESSKLLNKQWDDQIVTLRNEHMPLEPITDTHPNGRDIQKIYFGNHQSKFIHDTPKGAISKQSGLHADPVDEVIKAIVALFGNGVNSNDWRILADQLEQDIGHENPANVDSIDPLPYTRFKEFVASIDIESDREFNVQCRNPKTLLDKWESEKGKPPNDQKWLPVWHASGWTTEGPKCVGGSGVC